MVFRLSTLSTEENDGVAYTVGDLSLFPELIDDQKSLYTVRNNAETKLKQSVSYNGKHIVVEDASGFPPYGLLRLGVGTGNFELVYYDKRNSTTFLNLARGFAGSTQSNWSAEITTVSNTVMAEHHNAIKDAAIKIQETLGTKEFPDPNSLNGILKDLEVKHLAPKAMFRAYPKKGPPALTVRFQNFSNSESIRFLWDFGDGTTSIVKNPVHTYQTEGIYTVKLNMIMTTGAQGVSIKNDYITVSEKEVLPFFYAELLSDDSSAPAEYEFVDQTDGDITARYWVFDDGENQQVLDPNQHTVTHTYTEAGSYIPSLLIIFRDQSQKRITLRDIITIT